VLQQPRHLQATSQLCAEGALTTNEADPRSVARDPHASIRLHQEGIQRTLLLRKRPTPADEELPSTVSHHQAPAESLMEEDGRRSLRLRPAALLPMEQLPLTECQDELAPKRRPQERSHGCMLRSTPLRQLSELHPAAVRWTKAILARDLHCQAVRRRFR
jgi:hypothetical protein